MRTNGSGSSEALERKKRSEERLRAAGVPVNSWLPVLETEAKATFRPQSEVLDRALALLAVAGKGEGAPDEALALYMDRFEVVPKLSAAEKRFWADPAPAVELRFQFSWRYEALLVLLWSLGYVVELGLPIGKVSTSALGMVIFSTGPEGFRDGATLRPKAMILDEADLAYRYHWAVSDARSRDERAPSGLDLDVLVERRHALNWLIGYGGEDWDKVPTEP